MTPVLYRFKEEISPETGFVAIYYGLTKVFIHLSQNSFDLTKIELETETTYF